MNLLCWSRSWADSLKPTDPCKQEIPNSVHWCQVPVTSSYCILVNSELFENLTFSLNAKIYAYVSKCTWYYQLHFILMFLLLQYSEEHNTNCNCLFVLSLFTVHAWMAGSVGIADLAIIKFDVTNSCKKIVQEQLSSFITPYDDWFAVSWTVSFKWF